MIILKWAVISIFGVSLFGGLTGSVQSIDLVPEQVYRTGSPLSQPGILGLLGGLAHIRTGGGYEQWHGPYVAAGTDVENVQGAWSPVTAADYSSQGQGLTIEEVKQQQDKLNWPLIQNRKRAEDAPECKDGQLWITYVPDAEIGAHVEWECKR